MEQLTNFIESNNGLIFLVITSLFFIFMIIMIYNLISLKKQLKQYRKLAYSSKGESVESILNKVLDKTEVLEMANKDIEKKVTEMKSELINYPQRYGIIRYNAFGTGSDQSFSIALLDGKKDGVVLSTIYGREESRVYAKPIKEGTSTYNLSDEEKKVVDLAINKK
ncbi:DUF4446 family protein [Proteinivorax tanatarense]|uniref:DUF4446 family protein n=1 Tax=Proteinivorax tanatarense TaxID=1260629 RepID=A0AAU7VLC8_9FIRM